MQVMLDTNPTLCPLTETGFIVVRGEDSGRFLHGQLSQEIQNFRPNSGPLAAWHSPSGKVKAIVRVLRLDEGWLLVTATDLVDPLVADLQRFVLRDDVTISNAGDHWQAAALLGDATSWLQEQEINLNPGSGELVAAGGLLLLRVGPRLVQILGSSKAIAELATTIPRSESNIATLEEISLGIPQLTTALQDRFVPQMLNLDLLGALDEAKGCYPGQEIIARTQNLGTVKRRMLRFSAALQGNPDIGTKIVAESGDVVGEVIRSASANGHVEVLAVTQLESADLTLSLDVDRTVILQREPLPYDRI